MRRTVLILLAMLLVYGQRSSGRETQGEQADSSADEQTSSQEPTRNSIRPVVVPVWDIENAGRNPFQTSFEIKIGPSFESQATGQSTLNVPEGKRLVIEHVSIQMRGQTTVAGFCSTHTTTNGEPAAFFVALATAGGDINTLLIGNQPARAYADPGSVVTTACTRSAQGAARGTSVTISIIGHLLSQQ